MADDEHDRKHREEQIRRDEGDAYEEREGGTGRDAPAPADDPDEDDVPPLTEPGSET